MCCPFSPWKLGLNLAAVNLPLGVFNLPWGKLIRAEVRVNLPRDIFNLPWDKLSRAEVRVNLPWGIFNLPWGTLSRAEVRVNLSWGIFNLPWGRWTLSQASSICRGSASILRGAAILLEDETPRRKGTTQGSGFQAHCTRNGCPSDRGFGAGALCPGGTAIGSPRFQPGAGHSKELSTPKPSVALLYTDLTRGGRGDYVFFA